MHEKMEKGVQPLLITDDASIRKLLDSMGFADIFTIRNELPSAPADLEEIPFVAGNEKQTRDQVIEAHRTLMALSTENRKAFKDLVSVLEAQC